MRLFGQQVVASILGFDALDDPSEGFLVRDGLADGDALDLFVADHRRDAGRRALRMRQHPRPSDVLQVSNRAVALHLQIRASALKTRVQFFEVCVGLRDVAFEAKDAFASYAAVHELGQ